MKILDQKKHGNALNRSQLKEVMGGGATFRGTCDDWEKLEPMLCYQCCITVKGMEDCATKCKV